MGACQAHLGHLSLIALSGELRVEEQDEQSLQSSTGLPTWQTLWVQSAAVGDWGWEERSEGPDPQTPQLYSSLFTLGVRHRVPCKKVEYRQTEGVLLLPPKKLLLGQERAEGRGQRAEGRG